MWITSRECRRIARAGRALGLCALLALAAGCKSIGPGTITRDRFDYSGALAESWKNQMLLNLVKTRYLDLPIYLEVGQIVSGYSLETSASVSGQLAPVGRGDTFLGLGASGTFTDRPTITYTPLTGERFLQSFLTPIQPARVFSLVQSGYAADFILEMSLESCNGLRNRPVTLDSRRPADPEFFKALGLLRDLQEAGAVGLRAEGGSNSPPTVVVFFRGESLDSAGESKLGELRRLLSLAPGENSFRLVQSPLRGSPGEWAIGTRSLSQVMTALSLGVEIPAQHVERRLAPPLAGSQPGEPGLLRVHSGNARPVDAFVAVLYEGQWFWIEQGDWKSKRTFTSILFLFTLADAGGADRLPLLTIPTN